MNKEQTKKLAMTGVIAGTLGLGLIGGAMLFPQTETKVITVTEKVPVEVPVEVTVEVPVEMPIDNGNLAMVLDYLYNEKGNVEYILDDLDDDELEQVVDRISLVNDVKAMAVEKVKSEAFDELDKEIVTLLDNSTVELDEDDMSRLKIKDDADELLLASYDFDDKDFVVEVTARFEQDDVKFEAVFEVEFKDGEFEEISLKDVYQKA